MTSWEPPSGWWSLARADDGPPTPVAATVAPTDPTDVAADARARLARATPEVVVVGLGATGLTAVLALARRGVAVVGLDARGVAAGAAGGNGGFLLAGLASFHDRAVARHGRQTAVGWYRRTLEELDHIAAEEPSFRRVGSLRIAADDDERRRIAAHLTALRDDGLPGEAYDGPHGVGLLVPGDGVFHPVERCTRLAAEARAAGALLAAPARVTALGSGSVHVDGLAGPLRPRHVLVCVDGGLEHVVPSLAGRVRTARLQMLATAPDPAVSIGRPLYHRDGYDYVQQLPSGEVLLGGGRDVGGEGEWGAPATPSPAVQQHLDAWAARLGVTAPVTHRWAAHAAFTDDRLPVDEQVADGVHVLGAYSGHGNVIGTMLAREVAARLP